MGWWIGWDGREQKVGFDEKKLRLWTAGLPCMATLAGRWAWLLWSHMFPPVRGLPQPTLSRLTAPAAAISKLRFRLRLRLHGVVHNTPSPMAGLLHIEIAGVVRRVRRVMRMLSALFPRLLLDIRASQGGVMRDWCYALLDGGARRSLTASGG